MNALLKLILIFAGIAVLLGRQWNLGLVLVLASVATGILFSYPLIHVAQDALVTSVDLLTLRLALIVVLIMTLSELMRQSAGLKGMVEALQALIPNGHIVIAALPALVGFLPMIGGAMFSAPMVDEVGDRLRADRGRKTFLNYWFRHIWETVLPLYPSMLLGAAFLHLKPAEVSKATWPLALAAATGGLLFGLVGLARRGVDETPPPPRAESLRTLVTSIWPVVLVVALSMTLPIDDRFSLILSLLVTLSLMMALNRIPVRNLGPILHKRIPWNTVVVIFGALIFRRVLENSGAVLAISDALTELRLPLAAVAFGVPFISGLLTGLIPASFSIGFPVVLPMVAGGETIPSHWTIWLVAGGYLGAMSSPLHLCLSLTRVYFGAQWGPIYRRIVPSALLVAATAAAVLLIR